MQLIGYAKSTAVALFALGAATSVPLAPAVAAPTEVCYEAILFCKLHPHMYPTQAECREEQALLLCDAVAGTDPLVGDRR
ncbi:hypothetical protein [Sphingosinithalassobacter portus]|uniref:hypothetical protein n=1 Tax=Stakelama portus TaxID=2676234 RepID=UPI000D6E6216|nr:hypothetical protein [Sphingosinithalassobacter portus]